MQINSYDVNLRNYLNSSLIFDRLLKRGILNKDELEKIKRNLRKKYGIKDNSVFVFNSLDK